MPAERRWREELPDALGGERVDRVVAMITGASRAQAREWIAAGWVCVGGEPELRVAHRLSSGDIVEVAATVPEEAPLVAEPGLHVPVVYADDDLIVVDKPPGLVVHPGAGRTTGTVVNGLLARYPEIATVGEPHRPGVVHRLDRDTSGLLVVARSELAYRSLVADLAARRVLRRYLALVLGHPPTPTGRIDAAVGRHPQRRTRMAVVAGGREARTTFETVRTYREPAHAALLSCRLETGRTHQIRVHLASIGLPIVGDATYGRPSSIPAPRTMLHATELEMVHPSTAQTMRFRSDPPADFAAVLDGLTPGDH